MEARRTVPLMAWSCVALALSVTACLPGDVPPAEAASVPLWVVDQDSVTVTPFTTSRSVHNQGGGTPASFTVPTSERLVIRFVSASCTSTDGVPLTTVRVTATADHFLAPSFTRFDQPSNTTTSTITHETLIFAEPGSTVQLMAFPTTNPATTTCNTTVSGYLVEE